MPVVLASTYRAGGAHVYGRDENPTWEALEAAVGALEGGYAVAFASGMAAAAAVAHLAPAGGVVVAPGDAYKGTRQLLARLDAEGRLGVRLVETVDVAATVAACEGADVLWVESPTNPAIRIVDLAAVAGAAPLVVVDNTFATPLLQRPLALGADVVVHSATKAIAGHSDVVLGLAVAARPAVRDALVAHRSLHGAAPGPLDAFLALRGLRTLPLRVERAQHTAGELARRLSSHPGVESVHYPGLVDDPGHGVAARQMDGFGTVLSFVVRGGATAAERVCGSLRLVVPATSLGGVETTIERRAKYAGEEHMPPGLLRLSVGVEHVDDLWHDLDAALARARRRSQAGASRAQTT